MLGGIEAKRSSYQGDDDLADVRCDHFGLLSFLPFSNRRYNVHVKKIEKGRQRNWRRRPHKQYYVRR